MTVHSTPLVAPGATRTAPDGSTERAELRGREGERMLILLGVPASPPRGAVVVCSPLLGEFARNYRREVVLARQLVRRGFAVLRFHYRFTGNSDGEDELLSFESMREDALSAVEHLRAEVPDGPLFLLGTRWGALVAASAAAANPDAGVVLWEPLLDASRFFKEAFRSRLVKAVRDGESSPPTGAQLEEQLQAGTSVEVPAHRIHPAFYRSCAGRTIGEELGAAPRDVLVVQVGPTGAVRPELARQVERWQAAGIRVEATALRGEESWWLVEERWHDEAKRPMTRELVSLTAGWMEDRSPDGGRP